MKEKKKNSRRQSGHLRWEPLDNTANVFPSIAGENMTSVYRISCILKDEVDPALLQQALDLVLPQFDPFNVRLRTGIFWYYFEENGKKAPKVLEEDSSPCRQIAPDKNRSYLFRVTYFRRRINLEVFHVLTDGMGAVNFLRELTYQYLRLAHPGLREMKRDELSSHTSLDHEDSFVRNYKKARPSGFIRKKAYLLKMDRLPEGEFGVMHGEMSVTALKKICRSRGVSINDYLITCYVWALYRGILHEMPQKSPIRVAVPVNLRPYFDSVTTRNFFVMISAEFLPDREGYTFDEILEIIKESIHSQMSKEHLEDLFSYSVSNQKNPLMRAVPLVLKNPVIRTIYNQSATANTTTITNIGNIRVEEAYRDYIDLFSGFLAMSRGQFLKGMIVSFGDKLVFTFSSTFAQTTVQKEFFRKIASDGIEVRISTNDAFY